MTAGLGAEVGTDAGAATGSGIEVGVADPPHPASTRILKVPNKSEATGPEVQFSSVNFPLLISFHWSEISALSM